MLRIVYTQFFHKDQKTGIVRVVGVDRRLCVGATAGDCEQNAIRQLITEGHRPTSLASDGSVPMIFPDVEAKAAEAA